MKQALRLFKIIENFPPFHYLHSKSLLDIFHTTATMNEGRQVSQLYTMYHLRKGQEIYKNIDKQIQKKLEHR